MGWGFEREKRLWEVREGVRDANGGGGRHKDWVAAIMQKRGGKVKSTFTVVGP